MHDFCGLCVCSHRFCMKRVAAWCRSVREQLELGHQLLFPALLRYRTANQKPPKIFYVDQGCCSVDGEPVGALFPSCPLLQVRLDPWHFVGRLAAGVTAESHPLHPDFMRRISASIFEWDPLDISCLRTAMITTKEMVHCR
ncbi:hypothetical protein GOODEAATRI_016076, partial [Goodea atripinnis]